MRVQLGASVANRASADAVSQTTVRIDLSRELVDFLEHELPLIITAFIHSAASILILLTYHGILAATALASVMASITIYALASNRIYRLNQGLNSQRELQVAILGEQAVAPLRSHLSSIRNHEVQLSDSEAIIYGLIFAILTAMLGFNLWFSATRLEVSSGQIFTIVTYSYEFIEAAVALPIVLQSMTRVSEITARINATL